MFNPDFYPTPEPIVEKLLNGIDFYRISTILEPSAGSGNICKYIENKIKARHRHSYTPKVDLDCIEYEPQLRSILKGDGFRVVHDDFLTFQSMKRYSLIAMNPPFSNGADHLLKAIEIQEIHGGLIRCILNAETLKNPYSNNRKLLLRKLEKYNADIEFIEGAFKDAERTTNVEIAIVKLEVEGMVQDSIILDKLKQEAKYTVNDEDYSNQLVDGDYLVGIVQQFNMEVKAGISLIKEYSKVSELLKRSFKEDEKESILQLRLHNDRSAASSPVNTIINDYVKETRRKYWTTLFQSPQFVTMLTNELRQQWYAKVEELVDYDFSLYNINQIKIQMENTLQTSIEDTIIKLFDRFTRYHQDEYSSNVHYFDGWKTNKSYKINDKKVIIPFRAFDWYYNDKLDIRTTCDELQDIEKALTYLLSGDTLPEDNHEPLRDRIKYADDTKSFKNIDLKYFRVTFYKKGTTHIEWKYQNLVDKLNIFGCQRKGFLPPHFGKDTYENLSEEEKRAVDSFCGKEKYRDIVNSPNKYLFNSKNILMIA